MPRRAARVSSVARQVARPDFRHYPPGLPRDQRAAFDRVYNRMVRNAEHKYKRKLLRWEKQIISDFAIQEIRKSQAKLGRRVKKATAGVTDRRVPKRTRSLTTGRGKGGSGSTGLGGKITRRINRSPRKFLLRKQHWIDPFPWIPGTLPEKMIFANLVQRGIYFIFHGTPDDFQDADLLGFYTPTLHDFDFVLPQYRVVIDPFSEFHHAQADSIKRDTLRATVLIASGWAYYHPWAHEVEQNTAAVLDSIVEFHKPPKYELVEKDKLAQRAQGYRLGAALGTGAFSVGAANRKRRRGPTLRFG